MVRILSGPALQPFAVRHQKLIGARVLALDWHRLLSHLAAITRTQKILIFYHFTSIKFWSIGQSARSFVLAKSEPSYGIALQ